MERFYPVSVHRKEGIFVLERLVCAPSHDVRAGPRSGTAPVAKIVGDTCHRPALQCAHVEESEERRLAVENARTRVQLLENQRRALLRELATAKIPPQRRAEALVRRANLQRARDEAMRALRNLGEPVDEG